MNKLLIICGPTATGKTDLGIMLAKKLNGEIINADSRQVYQGMDIGTGKDIDARSKIKDQRSNIQIKNQKLSIGYRLKDNIPIWLVDICSPDYIFNLGDYAKLAKLVIQDIKSRSKLPIVVGGTGLYIRSIVEPLDKISIPPNPDLRQQLNNDTIEKLQQKLVNLDPDKFYSMNHSDKNNPRRLIRAIEIANYLKCHSRPDRESSPIDPRLPAGEASFLGNDINNSYRSISKNKLFWLGLKAPLKELNNRISQRVHSRVKQGIINEIQQLLDMGYSWDLPSMSSLGYREWKEYINSLPNIGTMQHWNNTTIEQWSLHEFQYAKRQLTWFKKVKQINWLDITEQKYKERAVEMVEKWYNKL